MHVRPLVLAAAALLLFGMISAAAAQTVVYSEDFETRASFPEWSTVVTDPAYQNPIGTERTPRGSRRFLGEFGAQTVTLTLPNLPRHDTVIVEFDWFIIGSMDGRNPTYADSFSIAEPNAGFSYCTSFSNFDLSPQPSGLQAFPGTCGGADFPAETGAAERSTLGYHFDRAYDAVYHMRLVIPHAAPALTLAITGLGLQELYDESWGVDNVKVTVHALQSGIAATPGIRFNAQPCVSTATDTLWVRSTGVVPLHIDSATISAGGAAFELTRPVLPLDIPPGDSVPFVIRLLSSPPGIYNAVLSFFSNADRSPFAISLDATLLPDTPRVVRADTSCGEPAFTITGTCGLGSVLLGPGSDNVVIEPDPPPPAHSIRTRVRLVDASRPGRYVLVANGAQVAGGTIGPTAVLAAPALVQAAAFGTDGCGPVTLHNGGSQGMWIDAVRMHRNISFSVPPAQLPLWIPPGESRDLIVCYQPGIDAGPDGSDTLDLSTPCESLTIALQGLSGTAFTGETRDCNATIDIRQAGLSKTVVLAHAPVIERDGSGLSIVIEGAAPPDAADVPLSVHVYDMLGRSLCGATSSDAPAVIREGARRWRRTYRADLTPCGTGEYMLVIAAPEGPIVRPFVVVR